jgi:hypothetical protein
VSLRIVGGERGKHADPAHPRWLLRAPSERPRRCGATEQRYELTPFQRADFLGHLHSDKPLFSARQQIDVPPLGEEELREVVSRPAQLLGARFETARLIDIMIRRTVEDSVKDVGALPLLSYTLDDMWRQMVARDDATLRLSAPSFELSGVLAERANTFVVTHPGAEATLRRILTLHLATVREEGEPTRRRAPRSEFSNEEWRLVSELADYPNRLLVTAATETGETYAEVTHEAIFRRWDKVRDWIAGEREFLAWKTGLEAARHAWQATAEIAKDDALLMGGALTQAQTWLSKRKEDLSPIDQHFIGQSAQQEKKIRTRARRVQALVYLLLVGIILGLIGVSNQAYIKEQIPPQLDSDDPAMTYECFIRCGSAKPVANYYEAVRP